MFNVRPRFSLNPFGFAAAATLLMAFLALAPAPARAQGLLSSNNVIRFAKSADSVMEGEKTNRVTVVRGNGLRGKFTVDVLVTDTNNIVGGLKTTNLVFNDFQLSASFWLPIADNGTTNRNSTVILTLTNAVLVAGQSSLLTPAIATAGKLLTLTVIDDDGPQAISFERANFLGEEGGSIPIRIKLGTPAADADLANISVDYVIRAAATNETTAGAAPVTLTDLDFGSDDPESGPDDRDLDPTFISDSLSGTLTFNTQGIATINVPVREDGRVEFDEEFVILLSNPRGDADHPTNDDPAIRIAYALNPALVMARGRILFNTNFLTQPMPGGFVDQTFNPENARPTFLRNPGANGPVTAVAEDPNGRYYVAGNFSAVNALVRHGVARLTSTGTVDTAFVPAQNINGAVNAMDVYRSGPQNGKVVIGGGFSSVSGQVRSSIARYLPNGALDPDFAIGLGANGPIYALKIEKDNSMIIAGNFTTFDGVPRGRIARLNPNGSLDNTTFNGPGANAPIFDLSIESLDPFTFSESVTEASTNTIVTSRSVDASSGVLTLTYNTDLEGDRFLITFGNQTVLDRVLTNNLVTVTNDQTQVVTTNGVPRTLRLDLGPQQEFPNLLVIRVSPGDVTNTTTWSYTANVDPSRTLSIAAVGEFTEFAGVPVNRIVKLDETGLLNDVFANNIGTGANSPIQAIDVQSDDSYIVGGAFQTFDSLEVGGIARLSKDGVLDRDFAAGAGANGAIRDIYVDRGAATNRLDKILIAGDFTSFNKSRRLFLARLHPQGFLDTTFLDSAFNQFAGFPNADGFAPDGSLGAVLADTAGDVFVGGRFDVVGGGTNRANVKPRQNYARLEGNPTPGPGNVSFFEKVFGADEDGEAVVFNFTHFTEALAQPVIDFGFLLTQSRDASAMAGLDYVPLNSTLSITVPSVNDWFFQIPLVDDEIVEGDEEFFLGFNEILGVKNLGGEPIYPELAYGQIPQTTGRIIENDVLPAIFSFSDPEYNADENRITASVEIYRTGNISDRVTVEFSALVSTNTNAASTPEDFATVDRQIVVFNSGVTNMSVTVSLRDDVNVEADETIRLELTGASTGSKLDTNAITATLNLIDNDLPAGKIDFNFAGFTVVEGQPAAEITVVRSGGNVGFITVDYRTLDDTAVNGSDYQARTGSLSWNDRDILPRTILVPILNDGLVETNEQFKIELFNLAHPEFVGTRNPTTTVRISDNDFYGSLEFGSAQYFADENGVGAIIQVVRRNGNAETVSVNYSTAPGSTPETAAIPGTDYTNQSGTLTFGPGETAKTFVVPIADDSTSDGLKEVLLQLAAVGNSSLGSVSNALLTIIDNERQNIPAGGVDTDFSTEVGANGTVNAVAVHLEPDDASRKILIAGEFTQVSNINRDRIARLNNDGTLDRDFAINTDLDGTIYAMSVLPEGAIIIAGAFNQVDGTTSKFVARLNSVGRYDTSFKAGAGPDNTVFALAQTFVGDPTNNLRRILIGGDFVTFDSVQRSRIAMIGLDGSLDLNFNPGIGPNGTVLAIAVQRDQKILIGGEFASVGGIPRTRIARLNADGSLDTTFDPGQGFDGAVRSIAIQADDRILVGGDFTTFNLEPQAHLTRLQLNGQRDATFNIGLGADGTVNSIALQTDGKIVVGGNFGRFNNSIRPNLVRLLQTGPVDFSINLGAGPNEAVNSVAIQSDRRILIGGAFTMVDGLPRNRVARIFGGSVAGSGSLEFAAPVYTVNESVGSATVEIRRTGGMEGVLSATYQTSPITATPGEDYTEVTNSVTFQPGETFKTVVVPILDDFLPEVDELILVTVRDPVGGTIGRQPVATIEIVSDDSRISIENEVYFANENIPGGRANIKILREGVATTPISVRFQTEPKTATEGVDYSPVNTVVVFAPGETEKIVSVPLLDETAVEADETVTLILSLVNAESNVTLGRAQAELIIANDDSAPGTLEFSGTTVVSEGEDSITLTVTRSAGRLGTVSVNYTTEDASAIAPGDYSGRTGILTFQQTDASKTIVIPIVKDDEVEGNETFRVRLSNPTGGAVLGPQNVVTVTIEDNDFGPGSLDQSFDVGAGVDGMNVFALVLQPDGKIVIGGDFTTFDNSAAQNVARVLPSGDLDGSFSVSGGPEAGPGNGVFALELADQGRIAVGGKFRSFASQDELFITRVTTNGTLDTTMSFSADLNDTVRAIARQPDTKVVVGGDFTIPTPHLARINTSGSLDVSFNVGSGAADVNVVAGSPTVYDVQVQSDGKVLIGGIFQQFGGVPSGPVVRILPNGLVDQSFKFDVPGTNIAFHVSPLSDGKVLVAGKFDLIRGSTVPHLGIFRLNVDGTLDTNFLSHALSFSGPTLFEGAVYDFVLQNDGKVVIAGDFTTMSMNGTNYVRNRVARLNADGSVDETFKPGLGPNKIVYDIELQPDGKILIAGAFTEVNGFPRSGLARLNSAEPLPDSFPITSFQVVNGDLQLAFTSVVGVDYEVQESTDLNTLTWTTIRNITATGTTTTVTGLPTDGQTRFFRVIVAP